VPDPHAISRTLTFRQTVYEPPSIITYRRGKFGFRGVFGSISSIDLVTIGGSTTAQTFITEGETWQDIIHPRTGLVIADAGLDGAGSQSVPDMLEDWIDKIPGINAKYFLHYVGINETSMTQTVQAEERRRHFL
jgi:hypothetical protein